MPEPFPFPKVDRRLAERGLGTGRLGCATEEYGIIRIACHAPGVTRIAVVHLEAIVHGVDARNSALDIRQQPQTLVAGCAEWNIAWQGGEVITNGVSL